MICYLSEDIKWVVGYLSVKFRGEDWVRGMNFGVKSI